MAGFSQGGGVGLALSQWMVNGDPGFDVWAMDVARFGEWATRSYTNAKVRENYSRRFSIRFPNEELPAARPQQTTSLYDVMLANGAVMGDSWGLETPLWFAPKGVEAKDIVSFHRSNDFPHVKAECLGVRERRRHHRDRQFRQVRVYRPRRRALPVAADDQSHAPPRPPGPDADAQPARQADRRFHHRPGRREPVPDLGFDRRRRSIICAGSRSTCPMTARCAFTRFDMGLVGLSIAGPMSRDVLQRLTDEDVSAAAFRFMDHRAIDVANMPAMVNRVTYTGDLGYEIWVSAGISAPALCRRSSPRDGSSGIVNFGMRALLSLRLEKNFPTWYRELRPIYGPYEADVERFVDLAKNDFIGSEAAMIEKEEGGTLRRLTMVVDADDADVLGDEPIWHDGKVVGWVTSGGYAHWVDKSLAQGYVPRQLIQEDDGFAIEIIGSRRPARPQRTPLFDPEGARMRG